MPTRRVTPEEKEKLTTRGYGPVSKLDAATLRRETEEIRRLMEGGMSVLDAMREVAKRG